jgi:hypothetical protein
VYDPVPIMEKTDPTGADVKKPYTRYNDVLDRYSAWLLEQQGQGWAVIDLHGPMKLALAQGRAAAPAFAISKDGVHPGLEGHALMAQAVLEAWGVPVKALDVATQPRYHEVWKAVQAKQSLLKAAWLTQTRHQRPGVPAGLPLPEAEALAAKSDAAARGAAAPK